MRNELGEKKCSTTNKWIYPRESTTIFNWNDFGKVAIDHPKGGFTVTWGLKRKENSVLLEL